MNCTGGTPEQTDLVPVSDIPSKLACQILSPLARFLSFSANHIPGDGHMVPTPSRCKSDVDSTNTSHSSPQTTPEQKGIHSPYNYG